MSALSIPPLSPPLEAERQLDWLCAQIQRNRFLPVPPAERIFVGDGGFLAVGTEFLRWFVRLGGLTTHERILDIGCGIGRMAVPLTQYLETGCYEGIDVAFDGIAWCRASVASVYPSFGFTHLDLQHPVYNPKGVARAEDIRLPYPDGAFDFVIMTSVATHLGTAELRAYAPEIRRVMAPGARLFLTAFLLNRPAREGLAAGRGAISFDGGAEGPENQVDPARPGTAVAYDEDFLLSIFLTSGLRRTRPAVYGGWSGRTTPGPSFQDINVFEIRDAATRAVGSDGGTS
jgi:SAM-dependent methyltransferase